MFDIKFDRVSKRYQIRQERGRTDTNGSIAGRLQKLRLRSEDFWALSDVSFEVERGEALGIIGHNGAGKSTILKLLSRITSPTSGEIRIKGRLSALIEVGSGFHPELTGRENVYLSGSILGMRRREITEKLESIIDFAGVRQFIDTPVKRYSSGMYVRLGFSIAAHLHPDILLLDEVLAVGDAAFQSKCLKRITELREAGTTIVFISHDLTAVELLCDRALLLSQGQVLADGAARDVVIQYQKDSGSEVALAAAVTSAAPQKAAEITSFTLVDQDGHDKDVFHTGRPIKAHIEYRSRDRVKDVVFEIYFYSADGRYQGQFTTDPRGERFDLERGSGMLEFYCNEFGLQPGIYYVDATIKCLGTSEDIDWKYRCATFRVDPYKSVSGRFYMPHEWRIHQQTNTVDVTPLEELLRIEQVCDE
jgi:ABC-type polysaccharide/polyol phosphate transport system ATPase subunit